MLSYTMSLFCIETLVTGQVEGSAARGVLQVDHYGWLLEQQLHYLPGKEQLEQILSL